MTAKARSKLEGYTEAGRLLAVELQRTIDDLRFEADGGCIYWAVDSSEVVAYTVPFDDSAESRMALFDDQEGRSSRIIEQYVLDRILFKTRPLVLLPAYGFELESFAAGLRARIFNTFVRQLHAMEEELKLRAAPQSEDILRIAGEVEESGRSLTGSELDLLSAFCREHASSLLQLAKEEFSAPLDRFRHLMDQADFVDLKELVPIEVGPGDEVFDRWYARFRKRREKDRSSFLDALAMATLHRANLALAARGARIQLLSRSAHMENVFRREAGLWEEAGGWILRHPRTFSLFHRPEGEAIEETLKVLEARLGSLQLFLNSATSQGRTELDAAGDDPASQALQRALEAVTGAVRSCEELAASKILESGEARESSAVLLGVLRMLSRREEFVRRVDELLVRLASDFERENELLGWLLQIQNEESRKTIDASLSVLEVERSTVLACTLESMPYSLEFNSPELQHRAVASGRKWGLTWQDALAFFRTGFAAEQSYERLLAMAYVLGALGQWSLARSYSERALAEPEPEEPTPRHEGRFFLAVCYRKIVPQLAAAELRAAIDILEQAIAERAAVFAGAGEEDPRYVKELATLMMNVNRRLRDAAAADSTGEAGGDALEPYSAAEIRELFERAFRATEDDPKLRLQVLNNLCYLYAETQAERGSLEEALARLEGFLLEIPAEQVPASVIDTLVFSHFQLEPEATVAELDRFLEELARAQRKIQRVDRVTMKVVTDHVAVIRERRDGLVA